MRWAMRGRSVVGKNWRFAICIAKILLENSVSTRFNLRDIDGFSYFKVNSWWGVIQGFESNSGGGFSKEAVGFMNVRCGGDWMEEEEEEQEER